jgi:mevalonate kinase
MKEIYTSAPGKIILFGEHAVNRAIAAIAAAVDRRVYCRMAIDSRQGYLLISGDKMEEQPCSFLKSFKEQIDGLRSKEDYDGIREQARDFFAPARYVLAHLYELSSFAGIEIEWHTQLPMGAGLGSGAATYTSLVAAFFAATGRSLDPREVAITAYLGDIIAHGGIASSLDSSTGAFGGTIRYTVKHGAQPLVEIPGLALVLIDTLVRSETAKMNTIVRNWLSESPARAHIFENVGFIVELAAEALAQRRHNDLGNLMDLHQLLQEQMGTGCPECRRSIELAHSAGALGAKITGSGGGGIVIALCPAGEEKRIADSIIESGGFAVASRTGTPGVKLEERAQWDELSATGLLDPPATGSFAGAILED